MNQFPRRRFDILNVNGNVILRNVPLGDHAIRAINNETNSQGFFLASMFRDFAGLGEQWVSLSGIVNRQ